MWPGLAPLRIWCRHRPCVTRLRRRRPHRPSAHPCLHVISVGIHRWWTGLIDQLDDRLMVGGKVSSAIYHDPDARTRPGLSEWIYHLIWGWTKYRSVASYVMASAVPGN